MGVFELIVNTTTANQNNRDKLNSIKLFIGAHNYYSASRLLYTGGGAWLAVCSCHCCILCL